MGNFTSNLGNNSNISIKDDHRSLHKFSLNDGLKFIKTQTIEGIS